MPSWDADEGWDDRDEPAFERFRKRPSKDQDEDSADEPGFPVPMELELEGSIYRIPSVLWWFPAPNRHDRPGLCVRCDLSAGVAVMCPGRDPNSPFSQGPLVVLVDRTPGNGLTKRTAFALTPWTISLRMLQLIHNDGERMGRLEIDIYTVIRAQLAGWKTPGAGGGQ